MPRVPVVNTRTQSSTNVPGMQAAPANRATSRAVSGLSKTVSNLAFQVAEKQQRQKDSTGEYELSNDLSTSANSFENENKRKIDIDGSVDGVDYTEAQREALQETQNAQLEKYRGTVSKSSFERMQLKSKVFIDNALQKANRIKQSVASKKAILKGNDLVRESVDTAMASGDHLQAYTSIANASQYQIDRADNFATPEAALAFGKESVSKISFGLTQGQIANGNSLAAIKTAGLENDEEVIASLSTEERQALQSMPMKNLSSNMTASQKIRVKSQAISAIKTADRLAKVEIAEGMSNVEAGVKLGIISSDEVKTQISALQTKAQKLTPEESVKLLGKMTKTLELSNTSEMLDSTHPNQWLEKANDSLSRMPEETFEDKRVKAELEGSIKNMMVKRDKEIKTKFADYANRTDVTVKKASVVAMDPTNPTGFKKYRDLLVAKADDFGRNESNIQIIPAPMKTLYKGLLESDNPEMVMKGLIDLEQHVGSDNFAKSMMEITKNPKLAVVTNMGDPIASQDYIRASMDKEFPKKWTAFKKTQDEKDNTNVALLEISKSDFFSALSDMPDGGASLTAHVDAASTMYRQSRMDGLSHTKATEKVNALFSGESALYDSAKSDNSVVLLPKNNNAGLTKEGLQKAMENVKEYPSELLKGLGVTDVTLDSLGVTAGKLAEEISFKMNQEGTGLSVEDSTGRVIENDDGKPIYIPWAKASELSEYRSISDKEISGEQTTGSTFDRAMLNMFSGV